MHTYEDFGLKPSLAGTSCYICISINTNIYMRHRGRQLICGGGERSGQTSNPLSIHQADVFSHAYAKISVIFTEFTLFYINVNG